MKKKVYFIVGPTASGKSELAMRLAEAAGGEIISADSMQVYRGMDIGTAKPSPEERRRIPHHLIDLVEPTEEFSVFDYRRFALDALMNITAGDRNAFVAGGSGLYVRALLRGLSPQPGGSPDFREKIQAEIKSRGLAFFYEKLAKADPECAARIKPGDERRIVRALEILEISGMTPSEWYRQPGESLQDLGYEPRIWGLEWPRDELYRRIDVRVESMFEAGLPEEAARLASLKLSRTARQAVGYKEILERLDEKGRLPGEARESALQEIQLHSRNLAKRQMTWFRREEGIEWLPAGDLASLTAALLGRL